MPAIGTTNGYRSDGAPTERIGLYRIEEATYLTTYSRREVMDTLSACLAYPDPPCSHVPDEEEAIEAMAEAMFGVEINRSWAACTVPSIWRERATSAYRTLIEKAEKDG